MKKSKKLEVIRNLSDKELISLSNEIIYNRVFSEHSLLRNLSKHIFGDDDGDTVVYMTTKMSALIMEVMSERLEAYSPHID